ncbi:MAG: hypothetical protein JWM85_3594 [Acidimicrobiaceae bacterium]|nr:hypothetical protein [Acidimicrobiaceae bacterium]
MCRTVRRPAPSVPRERPTSTIRAVNLQLTPSVLVIDAIVSVLAAAFAYRAAQRLRLQVGTTPWHLPAWLWAVFFLVSPVIGLLAFLIARATTRPTTDALTQRIPADWSAGTFGAGGSGGGAIHRSEGRRTEDERAERRAEQAELEEPVEAPVAGNPPPPGEHLPPYGWYPDPGGRHELRYWDGRGWTDYVSDQGVRSEDPG